MQAVMEKTAMLPQGWKVAQLGDVLSDIIGGGTPSRNVERYWNGDIPWITVKDMRTRRPELIQEHITRAGVDECATNIIPADTVITATRVGLGKVVRVPYPAAINQDLKALIVGPKLDKSYLEWWIIGNADFIDSIGSGTTVKGIRLNQLRELEIPLAPLPEQRRIVEAIELQLGRLDAAVAHLHAAKAKLKRYKQAVLKAAVEGRLTNPDIAEGNLPEGWRQVAIKDIAELLNGDRGKNYPSSKHYVEAGVPFINTGHIEPNGQLSQERMNHITRERFNILNAGKIVRGDIVYCLRGATLGKTAIVDFDEGAIASSLMIIRLRKDVSREFIYYYLTSDLGRRNIADYDNGTAQPNLSAKSVGKYLVPLPPFDEQLRIVEHVGVRLNQMEHMETTLDVQLSQATRLRQAVLKRAFEGRLTTNDAEA